MIPHQIIKSDDRVGILRRIASFQTNRAILLETINAKLVEFILGLRVLIAFVFLLLVSNLIDRTIEFTTLHYTFLKPQEAS